MSGELQPERDEIVRCAIKLYKAHQRANDPERTNFSSRLDAACGTAHDELHDAVARYLRKQEGKSR